VHELLSGEEAPQPIGEPVDWQAKQPEQVSAMRIGDLCPECGQAALVNEEGCRKCYVCGYSEC
jgi:ribonucleoside-diphosphate reductase alpha chain